MNTFQPTLCFREIIEAPIGEMKTDFKLEYADRALDVAQTLQTMQETPTTLWISRGLEKLIQATESIHAVAPLLMEDLEQTKLTSFKPNSTLGVSVFHWNSRSRY